MRIPRVVAVLVHQLNRLRLRIIRPLTVGVRLIFVRDGQVLLVRHTYHDGWLLPGGGVKKGETLEAAARREALEELGIQPTQLRLHGVYTNFFESKSDHVVVFICEAFELPTRAPRSLEIASSAFFPCDALPQDLLPGHRRRLLEMLQNTPAGTHFGMW